MSKLETPLTRWYWEKVGGTLIEEFPLVRRSEHSSARWADGLVIPDGETRIAKPDEIHLAGQDVIVVQTKAARLGMYLLGQAVFSAELLRQHHDVGEVRAVAVCLQDDEALHRLLVGRLLVEVVVAQVS